MNQPHPRHCYPHATPNDWLDLVCAVVRLAVQDLRDGRRYRGNEPDPARFLEHAGMLHLAERALATTIQEKH